MTIEGAMTALITPMRGGEVDYPALSSLIDEQIEAGIDGLVSVGTTGESATLTVREHIDVIRHTVKAARGRVPIIAGAGGNATREAIELSKASEEVGADALLHVVPYYNKPTQDGLYLHFSTVARATSLPIVLYNVPGRTACDLGTATTLRLADIDNIVALKDATANMRRASELIAGAGDRLTVLSGDDFTSFTLYALGGRGVISVVSNVMPKQVAEMWDAVRGGDLARARELHYALMPLTELLFAEANPIPVKAALALMGRIDGEIRPPLAAPSPALSDRLKAQLRAEGLL